MRYYEREIKRRYYDYDAGCYKFIIWTEAVISNDISKYNSRKKKRFREVQGWDLFDWYTRIMDHTGVSYVNIEHVYSWKNEEGEDE